jgi:hypothetical protein
MDYCHPCRRYLNGALACPGCGAPTREPRSHEGDPGDGSRPDGGTVQEPPRVGGGDSAGPRSRRRAARDGPAPGDGNGGGAESGADGGGADSGRGPRSSRRDRKAAAHRRRRRRALSIGAGLLFAAGGLSFAELGTEAPGPNPPTTTDGEEADGAASPDPSAETDGSADRSRPSPAKGSATPSASKPPKREKGERRGEEDRLPSGGASPDGTAPAPVVTPPETPAPDPRPTAEDPSPEPSPSQTCERLLWWCA